jgi:hypothetical protein
VGWIALFLSFASRTGGRGMRCSGLGESVATYNAELYFLLLFLKIAAASAHPKTLFVRFGRSSPDRLPSLFR